MDSWTRGVDVDHSWSRLLRSGAPKRAYRIAAQQWHFFIELRTKAHHIENGQDMQ